MKLKSKYRKYSDEAMKECSSLYEQIDKVFSIRDKFIASLYDIQRLEAEVRKLRKTIKSNNCHD